MLSGYLTKKKGCHYWVCLGFGLCENCWYSGGFYAREFVIKNLSVCSKQSKTFLSQCRVRELLYWLIWNGSEITRARSYWYQYVIRHRSGNLTKTVLRKLRFARIWNGSGNASRLGWQNWLNLLYQKTILSFIFVEISWYILAFNVVLRSLTTNISFIFCFEGLFSFITKPVSFLFNKQPVYWWENI